MKQLNIRSERIKRGWTLEYVGLQVGLLKTTIYSLETGKSKPSYNVLVKLEDLFQMPHRELFAEIHENNLS